LAPAELEHGLAQRLKPSCDSESMQRAYRAYRLQNHHAECVLKHLGVGLLAAPYLGIASEDNEFPFVMSIGALGMK